MSTPTELADELLTVMFESDPVSATLYGFHDRDDELPDISAAGEQAFRERADDIRVRAMAVDTAHADLEQRLTIAVVIQHAQALIAQFDARSPEYTVVGSLFAPVAGLLFHLGQVSPADARQGADFVERLRRIPDFTAAAAQRHREGVASGRVPVRVLVDDAVRHLDDYLAAQDSDPLLVPELHDPALEQERKRVLTESVHPALREYRNALATEIAPHARPVQQPGLCWIPGGHEIYQRLVRAHTSTDRTPQQLHDIGLARIKALRAELAELGARTWGEQDPDAVLHRLRTDPELRWRDGEELLTSAREAVTRAEAAAPQWFETLPDQPCEVRPMPGTATDSTPIGLYNAPALDGSRPGVYFANTDRAEQRQRFNSEVIAFHEVVPGHHMQLSLAQLRTELPLLRRLIAITAYAEGWGLYTERLADEMGLYSDDVARMGMVAQDLLRAARLVVDTGLHEFGWSRQRAVDYLLENTILPQLEVDSETDRYISFPAQALSYLVGKLEIERVRRIAEQRLGKDFDIRGFHQAILRHGALPMSTLDLLVTEELHAR
ncbi:Uncharacterized conserved protein, DUF885 familyt [Saccharopolyspora antimicrobica]|uniref:Uncharacterized conserved protein, DUF885 familyt n=1 Tax=Saccharopolyspora antimicrobica TaxID=455193 RepID=A0A1I5AAR4_9PSEU|nr:DUF885 domain-containing protein [Saccharopolyspora antimicrobica]RKT83208.1 uncharacterized protein (DUF885 family) [Saccharopolyspora antimicrobica]SFN59574.1 Uncharacterized conserved protein, DUF885 familyt [Saccharopolyspora antimicrobica]